MSRSCFVVSVLLMLAVTANAIAPTDEEPQDKRILMGDAHLQKEATTRLAAAGVKMASTREAEKDDSGDTAAVPLEAKPSGGVATQGDGQSSSSGGGGGSTGGEHGKEEGNNKEGEKQAKSCLSKEECHKKRLLCGKGCTLSAHTKCAAKCSKSCVPTC